MEPQELLRQELLSKGFHAPAANRIAQGVIEAIGTSNFEELKADILDLAKALKAIHPKI